MDDFLCVYFFRKFIEIYLFLENIMLLVLSTSRWRADWPQVRAEEKFILRFFKGSRNPDPFLFYDHPKIKTQKERKNTKGIFKWRKMRNRFWWMCIVLRCVSSFPRWSVFVYFLKDFYFLKEKHKKQFTIFLFVLKRTSVFWKLNKNTRVSFFWSFMLVKKKDLRKNRKQQTHTDGNWKRHKALHEYVDWKELSILKEHRNWGKTKNKDRNQKSRLLF